MLAIELGPEDEAAVEQFGRNLFMACLATMERANVRLGLRPHEAPAGAGPTNAGQLASSAGIADRYAQEWLEQQRSPASR